MGCFAPNMNQQHWLQLPPRLEALPSRRPAPAPAPPAERAPAKAELLSFSETPSYQKPSEDTLPSDVAPAEAAAKTNEHEQRAEAALFAYISGEGPEKSDPKPRRRLGKLAV